MEREIQDQITIEKYLIAATPAEKQIRNYILNNASEELKAKILEVKNKNIGDCLNYIAGEFRNKAKNNCAVGTDEEVYGMAIHYFEEDEIKPNLAPQVASVKTSGQVKSAAKPNKPKKANPDSKEEEHIPNLFDFLGD